MVRVWSVSPCLQVGYCICFEGKSKFLYSSLVKQSLDKGRLTLNNSDSLVAGGNFNIKEFNLNQGALLQEFKFKGKDFLKKKSISPPFLFQSIIKKILI